jgi:hypothetical protein
VPASAVGAHVDIGRIRFVLADSRETGLPDASADLVCGGRRLVTWNDCARARETHGRRPEGAGLNAGSRAIWL